MLKDKIKKQNIPISLLFYEIFGIHVDNLQTGKKRINLRADWQDQFNLWLKTLLWNISFQMESIHKQTFFSKNLTPCVLEYI